MARFTKNDEGKYIKILKYDNVCGLCVKTGTIKQVIRLDGDHNYGIDLKGNINSYSKNCITCSKFEYVFV